MKRDVLHYLFEGGIVIKGIDGALEMVGGLLLLVVNVATLNRAVVWLTQHELIEDPTDVLANLLVQTNSSLSVEAKLFAAGYLLSHGLTKIVLVWSLLRQKRWAYPAAIVFLLTFIGYQAYRLNRHYAVGLLALTVFDGLVVLLTVREYRLHRRAASTP